MDPFREQVDANPEDWNLRLVYADWLDEQGRDVEASGQRWQAANRRRPYGRQWSGPSYEMDKWLSHLPDEVFKVLYNPQGWPRGNTIVYESPGEADAELARALATIATSAPAPSPPQTEAPRQRPGRRARGLPS